MCTGISLLTPYAYFGGSGCQQAARPGSNVARRRGIHHPARETGPFFMTVASF
jgi:hypothetical protein